MTSINLFARRNRSALIALRPVAREVLAFLARTVARLFRTKGPRWSSLNARQLADIGETPASAEFEALRGASFAPLGTLGLGSRVGPRGGPLGPRPTSPLG